MAIVAGAYALTFVVTSSGLGGEISNWFLGITDNKYLFLFIVNILFLLLGMFFDVGVLQLVFIPLMLPMVRALGIDTLHFGVLITVNIMMGMVTPPFGMLCFITSGISKVPVQKVFKEALPMVSLMIIVLFLITYFPALVTAIPNLLM